MSETTYIKLKDVSEIVVKKVLGYTFKQWNAQEGKMEVSDTPQKGFSKRWSVETADGVVELSDGQLGQMLSGAFDKQLGASDLNGAKFEVRNNGKTGKDIRYWINYRGREEAVVNYSDSPEEQGFNPDDVEF